MSYVDRIIDAFGGPRSMARAGGWPPTTVYDWKYRGVIPSKRQQEILDLARSQGVQIGPADFFEQPGTQPAAAE